MNDEKRNRLISLGLTILFHLLVIILLIFLGFPPRQKEEESGVLVMVGQMELSAGNDAPKGEPMQQPEVEPEPVEPTSPPQPTPEPTPVKEPPMIAQNTEPAPAIAPKEKKPEVKKEPVKKVETEAEKKKKEEERKEAERKREEQRKRDAEKQRQDSIKRATSNLMANAFNKNGNGGTADNHGTGTIAQGAQGAPNGNSNMGASKGSPGYGSYDLGGRGMRGALPKPSFTVNASGTVVVSITVNAQGNVIDASVRPRGTTATNTSLRQAAIAAAKKAKFDVKPDANIQYGTITYKFDSDN